MPLSYISNALSRDGPKLFFGILPIVLFHCRVADVARVALTERSGSSTKGWTPNIRNFVAKLSIVTIYALFERLSQGFERKSSCFRRAFNESHLAFVELSTKAILLS